jgi:hypothetical protein
MAKLNGGRRTQRFQKVRDAPILVHMLVCVQSGARVGLASSRLDGGFFPKHHAGTADGKPAEMDEVPVSGAAIDRAILTHRGDHDAVANRKTPQRHRLKQQGYGRPCRGRILIDPHGSLALPCG